MKPGDSFHRSGSVRLALVAGLVAISATGCPDNPYKASSWTKKLGGREHERAVQELEQLGDPSAIPDLGETWMDQGRVSVRDLQVIISLARPLKPEEAKEKFVTDYEEKGREASWDKALPFLMAALVQVDEANARLVDGATKAAEAMGEAKIPEGLGGLVSLLYRCKGESPDGKKTFEPPKYDGGKWDCANGALEERELTRKLSQAQIAAIKAMGKYDNEKAGAAAALTMIIGRKPPDHPRTAPGAAEKKALEENYTLFLSASGAAINSLGELKYDSAANTLILSLYKTPELASQLRRALVATGPKAKAELRKVLTGKHPEVEKLFVPAPSPKKNRMDYYCGDKKELPDDQCKPVSLRDFYAALVLGDFYDPDTIPDLLAALDNPPLPAFLDGMEADCAADGECPTQYNSVFDALRKIGAPSAAQRVRSMWMGSGAPAGPAPKKPPGRGAPAAPAAPSGPDLQTKVLAIGAYAFVSRDQVGVDELGKIAADNGAEDLLRKAAAESFARLARDPEDIKVLDVLADKYKKASVEKKKASEGKPKEDADKADKEFAAEKKKNDDAKAKVLAYTRDPNRKADEIKAVAKEAKDAEEKFKLAKKKHRDGTAQFKQLEADAKAYMGFARMFQMHIARIEIAIRCKDDLACYAKTLMMKPDDVVKNLCPTKGAKNCYIDDLDKWSKDERMGLHEGYVERAMLEIGKKGKSANSVKIKRENGTEVDMTDLLLEFVVSDNRIVRQSILLALPKIAKDPCTQCYAKLEAAIKSGQGKVALASLNLETTMLQHYFGWKNGTGGSSSSSSDSGTKTPEAPPPPPKKEPEKKAEPAKPPAKPAGKPPKRR
jgi:hypothetical protein